MAAVLRPLRLATNVSSERTANGRERSTPQGATAALSELAVKDHLDERPKAALEILHMSDDEVQRMLTRERTR